MAALSGKVVIVTGASRGIGAAAAEALATAGAAVMLTARDGKLAAKVADGIIATGGKAASQPCDVADYAAMEALVAATTQRFGRPDILVNNAGVIEPIATIARSDPPLGRRQSRST
jgi:3-oxoacyl-[acyl-carrier protein] reductase